MGRRITTAPLKETPEPHTWLSVGGRKHYREIMPLLVREGVVKQKDVWLVESACENFAIWQDTDEAYTVRKAALQQYQKIMEAYGVTFKASKQLALLDRQDRRDAVDDRFRGYFGDDD